MSDPFVSYAPNAEDVILWRALRAVGRGCYVDVGVLEPTTGSATRALYERGWRGLHVTPLADAVAAFHDERPGDVAVAALPATGPEGRRRVHVVPGPDGTGGSDQAAVHTRANDVVVLPLDDLLAEGGVEGRDLHLMRLDVDGAEAEALAGLDLGRWRPWVLVVRAPRPGGGEAPQWEPALLAAGYRLALFDGLNTFYAADGHLELLDALTVPVSVLDPWEHHERRTRRQELEARATVADGHARELEEDTARRTLALRQTADLVEEDARRWRADALRASVSGAQLSHQLVGANDVLYATRHTISWRMTEPLRRARLGTARWQAAGGARGWAVHVAARLARGAKRHQRPPAATAVTTPIAPAVTPVDAAGPVASSPAPPASAALEAALAQRLEVVSALLTDSNRVPGDDLGSAAGRFERALRLTARPERTVAWLAWVAVRASFPGEVELDALTQVLQLHGPDALAEWAWADTAGITRDGTASTRRLAVHEDGVLVDVTHTAGYDFHTGVQRVVRETAARWSDGHGAELFGWDLVDRFPSLLAPAEVERFGAWREHTSGGSAPLAARPRDRRADEVLIPWRSTLLVPEIAAEHQRNDAYRALAAAGILRSFGAIVYDLIPITIRETAPVGMSEVFSSYLAMLKHADRVSAISEATGDGYAAFSRMLAAQGLTGPEVAAHSLPSEVPVLDVEVLDRVRRSLDTGEDPVVLVVGSHEPRKNHLTVLVAAERLWRAGHVFHLLFIGGSGWRGERFDELVAHLRGDGRAIDVIKRADEDVLWAAYRLARFTVFPSLSEGFGLPVAESLASGTPAITSGFGSMAEIAVDGGALLVDPRDVDQVQEAMGQLLSDDDLLDQLRAQAQERTWKTWDDYAEETWRHLVN